MISIKCFKGLPTEYESYLIEKYDSFITTCGYIETHHPTHDINYMLVYNDRNLIELIVFANNGDTSVCLNSLASIDQDIIKKCIEKIFEIYPFIKKVEIAASYNEYAFRKAISYPKTDNHILDLPSTMDDYYSKLGSSTRQTIKNRKVRLLKEHSDVNFVTKYGVDIEEQIIEKIILLSYNRLKNKGVTYSIDPTYKNRIYKYSQHYGCVAYIEIDGVIAAGCICSILNKSIFGHVNAFDSNFSRYNPGELCAFYLIQTSIENGLSTFHFLWGKSDLKKRLLSKPRILFSYGIYKTYSFDYVFNKINILFLCLFLDFKKSKFSLPLRNGIKSFRKKKWKV